MVKQDELRMIKYLLGNTNLSMEVRNGPEAKTFTLNTGTPPGHSCGSYTLGKSNSQHKMPMIFCSLLTQMSLTLCQVSI